MDILFFKYMYIEKERDDRYKQQKHENVNSLNLETTKVQNGSERKSALILVIFLLIDCNTKMIIKIKTRFVVSFLWI